MTAADTDGTPWILPGNQHEFEEMLGKLEGSSAALDRENIWPDRQFQLLAGAGVLGWVLPTHFGGSEVTAAQLTKGYELLAQACLTTTFVLTQRNGACQRIAGADDDALKEMLLPDLCSGKTFATVGISHLTTSRQYLKTPAVQVRETDRGFVFNGMVPWVTGAPDADIIVTGGTMADGRQVLAALPTNLPGHEALESVELMALTASRTGPVRLDDFEIDHRYVIRGPVEQVMKQGKGGGTGSLATSALAVGVSRAALGLIGGEAEQRSDLLPVLSPLQTEFDALSRDLHALAATEFDPAAGGNTDAIRQRANSLVLRATQAALTATKGAGYVSGHPAERLVREAMFFLVWSCPQPVAAAALREFACIAE